MQIEPLHFIPPEPKVPFNPEEAVVDCTARAGIYRLLVGVFAEEASPEFLDALRQPDSMAALAEAGLRFDPDFTDVPLDALVDALACEYASLFVAPGGATPIESVRRTGRAQQEPYYEAKADYRRLGFALQHGRFKTVEDHLGAELSFVAELLERAASAAQQRNEKEFRRIEREIKRFWTMHLGRWARGYGQIVAKATTHSFYREMAKFLTAFGEDEVARMKLKVEDVDGRPPEKPSEEILGLEGTAPGACCGSDATPPPMLQDPASELPKFLL
ncbi:MAG: molecular chaperone [Thiothrix sp.]